MTTYLTSDEVIQINRKCVLDSREPFGLRSVDALESAVGRPASGYYDDVIAEAAALWESLAGNHPFVNGNKRTAFAATHLFLKINGLSITAGQQAVVDFIAERYATQPHTMNHASLDGWLRANSRGSG